MKVIGGILRHLCEQVTTLTDWILLRCLFLANEVDHPPANPPDMVFMVLRNSEGFARLMSV